jgi:hypothetical protein
MTWQNGAKLWHFYNALVQHVHQTSKMPCISESGVCKQKGTILCIILQNRRIRPDLGFGSQLWFLVCMMEVQFWCPNYQNRKKFMGFCLSRNEKTRIGLFQIFSSFPCLTVPLNIPVSLLFFECAGLWSDQSTRGSCYAACTNKHTISK